MIRRTAAVLAALAVVGCDSRAEPVPYGRDRITAEAYAPDPFRADRARFGDLTLVGAWELKGSARFGGLSGSSPSHEGTAASTCWPSPTRATARRSAGRTSCAAGRSWRSRWSR